MASDPDGSRMLLPFLGALPDSSAGNWVLNLMILILLTLLGAFFASAETAILSLPENKIRKMAESGHKRAGKIVRMTQKSGHFLSTLRAGLTLTGFLAAAAAAQSFCDPLIRLLNSLLPTVPMGIHTTVSLLLITLLLTLFYLVFGDMLPRKLAVQDAEKTAFSLIGALEFVAALLTPLLWVTSALTHAVVRLFGMDPNAGEQTVTEEKILMMVDAGEEKGVIEESAKDMIEGIFEFDDTFANEVMTHRTDVTALEGTATLHEAVDLALASGFSRIPVYDEDLDTILGILYAKDLLKYFGTPDDPDRTIDSIVRPALFVPEGKKCSELFAEMTENKTQIAVIVDEYGGTEGIVTMEDLVESIVGNIQDEYDNEEEEISQLSENAFTLEGTAGIDEVSELAGVEIPEGDYDTIAGFMVARLGRIPKAGEHPKLEIGNASLSVEQVEDRRISKILLVKNKEAETESR